MNFNFSKYQGTGNDFILADNRKGEFNNLTIEQVKKLCHRRFGIGADGLMLLQEKEGYDFEMIYFNSDGNEGSMCGNGGRCIVKFAAQLNIIKDKCKFWATDGEHEATIDTNGVVSLKMNDVKTIQAFHNDFIIDTGSPHYIKRCTDVMLLDVYTQGYEIRNSSPFKEKGINVNFVEQTEDPNHIIVRTFERGVEDETMSCGTGVTAAALACGNSKQGYNEVKVSTTGGDLTIKFTKTATNQFENIWLCGPATFVFDGIKQLQ